MLPAVVLFEGASIVDGLSALGNNGHILLSSELMVDAVLNLIAGGLLIGGAVSFGNGTSNGRVLPQRRVGHRDRFVDLLDGPCR